MQTILKIFSFFTIIYSCSLLAQSDNFDRINSENVMSILPSIVLLQNQDDQSVIQVAQYGNHNFSEITTNSNTDLILIQNGNYNFMNFDNSFENDASKTIITAEGNNNIIDVVGSNSISEKMQIHVRGDNKTIFVRNF